AFRGLVGRRVAFGRRSKGAWQRIGIKKNRGGRKMRGQELGKVVVAPKNAAEFAGWGVEQAKKAYNVTLDYSVGSLKHIDDILEQFFAEHVTVDDVYLSLFCFGCYVGEVIVRNNRSARWISLGDNEYESELDTGMVVKLASGTIVNPIGKAAKRTLSGEIDQSQYFYKACVEDDPGGRKQRKN